MKKLLILTLLICFNSFSQEILYPRQDHAKHYVAGMAVGGLGYFFAYELTQNKPKSLAFGILAGFVVGTGKELGDVIFLGGDFEVADIAWTGLGSVSVVIPLDYFFFNKGNKPHTAYPIEPSHPTRQEKRIIRMNERVREKDLRDSIRNSNKQAGKFWH